MRGIWRSSSFLPLLPFTTLPHFLCPLEVLVFNCSEECCRVLSTLPGQPQGSKPSLKHSHCPAQSNVGAADSPPLRVGTPSAPSTLRGAWAIPAACQTEGVCASSDMWEEATADLLYF